MTNIAQKVHEVVLSNDIKLKQNLPFRLMYLQNACQRGLSEAGFIYPTVLQANTIPVAKSGADIIIQAKSGTGKTLIFCIAILEAYNPLIKAPQSLVLVPTREVALQIQDVLNSLGKFCSGFKAVSIIGGTDVNTDRKNLQNARAVIGTPGRVAHLLRNLVLNSEHIKLFVVDEADKFADDSLQDDFHGIYLTLKSAKQVIACSATFGAKIETKISKIMKSPLLLSEDNQSTVLLGVKQFVYDIPEQKSKVLETNCKIEILKTIFSRITFNQCLVFVNSQSKAESYNNLLRKEGWPSEAITGAQNQETRSEKFRNFRDSLTRILISTDLMSRGMDFKNVNLVVNIDLPMDCATYLHRIGRVCRFGVQGIAVSFLASKADHFRFWRLFEEIGQNMLVYEFPRNNVTGLEKFSPNSFDESKLRKYELPCLQRDKENNESNNLPEKMGTKTSKRESTSTSQHTLHHNTLKTSCKEKPLEINENVAIAEMLLQEKPSRPVELDAGSVDDYFKNVLDLEFDERSMSDDSADEQSDEFNSSTDSGSGTADNEGSSDSDDSIRSADESLEKLSVSQTVREDVPDLKDRKEDKGFSEEPQKDLPKSSEKGVPNESSTAAVMEPQLGIGQPGCDPVNRFAEHDFSVTFMLSKPENSRFLGFFEETGQNMSEYELPRNNVTGLKKFPPNSFDESKLRNYVFPDLQRDKDNNESNNLPENVETKTSKREATSTSASLCPQFSSISIDDLKRDHTLKTSCEEKPLEINENAAIAEMLLQEKPSGPKEADAVSVGITVGDYLKNIELELNEKSDKLNCSAHNASRNAHKEGFSDSDNSIRSTDEGLQKLSVSQTVLEDVHDLEEQKEDAVFSEEPQKDPLKSSEKGAPNESVTAGVLEPEQGIEKSGFSRLDPPELEPRNSDVNKECAEDSDSGCSEYSENNEDYVDSEFSSSSESLSAPDVSYAHQVWMQHYWNQLFHIRQHLKFHRTVAQYSNFL